jgi:hypothetical protein
LHKNRGYTALYAKGMNNKRYYMNYLHKNAENILTRDGAGAILCPIPKNTRRK